VQRTLRMERGLPGWSLFLILSLVILLGLWFRLENLESRGIGHMEIYTPGIDLPVGYNPSPRLSFLTTLFSSMQEPHPPVWYIAMYCWTKMFGTEPIMIRLPSVLFGTGCILLLYLLGTFEKEKKGALLAAGLLAFNGFHVYWSQLARPTTMACFLGLLSTYFLIKSVRGHPKNHWLVLLWFYGAVTLCGLGTSYYFWIIFATHILWVLLTRTTPKFNGKGLFQTQILILILASPLITLAIYQSRPSYLGSNSLFYIHQFFSFGFLFKPARNILLPFFPSAVYWLLPFLGFILLGFGLMKPGRGELKNLNENTEGPSTFHLGLGTGFALICILVFMQFGMVQASTM